MKNFRIIVLMFVCFVGIYGCSDDANKTDGTKEVNTTKKVRSIEELNNLYFTHEGPLKKIRLATAYANFGFPIYEGDASALLTFGNNLEHYAVKNDQFSEIIQAFGHVDRSTHEFTPKAFYLVTGFHDEDDKVYKEIQEKYTEVTYEETAENQSVHWVTSDGLYHRYIVLGSNMIDKDEFLKDATFSKNTYEENIVEAPVLPAYFVVSAVEYVIDESEINITSSYTWHGGINQWETGYLVVPQGTSIDEAMNLGDKVFKKTVELLKKSPMYHEESWKDYDFSIKARYTEQDDPFVIGRKSGIDTLKWQDTSGNALSAEDRKIDSTSQTQTSAKALSATDVFTLADKFVEEKSKEYGEYPWEGLFKINIDYDEYPEIFTLKMLPTGTSEVSILEYNVQTQQWEQIYSDASFEHYDRTDALEILLVSNWLSDQGEQYVFLGRVSGSGGYLSFFVLGADQNGNVRVKIDRMNETYPMGEIVEDLAEKKILVKSNGEVVETFTIDDLKNGK